MRRSLLFAALAVLLTCGTSWASMSSYYDTRLDVQQTVTPEGPNWRYTFAFVNTDSQALWHFAVYTEDWLKDTGQTPLAVQGRGTLWYCKLNYHFADCPPEYDARNIVPELVTCADSWVKDPSKRGDSVNAVKPLETGYNFSFVASWHDLGPKFYCYEVGQVWAPDDGKVSAYGWTDAAPGLPAFALTAAAPLAGLLVRLRRQR